MIHLRETLATLRRESHTRALLLRSLFWFYPVCWIALWLTARVLRDRGRLGDAGYENLLRANLVLALVLALLASWLLNLTVEGAAVKIATGGSSPRGPTFSLEEAMIARGDHAQARAMLEARLQEPAERASVLLRLADLDARYLRDPAAAERWYHAAGQSSPDAGQQAAIANGLIDLYRATGQSGKLMVELARFAHAHPASPAGRAARRELREMKDGLVG